MDTQVPISVKIVAWLFFFSGIAAAIEILISLRDNHININFGVLGIFIGLGILNLREGWRVCSLVFIWLGLVGLPIVILLMLSQSGPFDFNLFGQKRGEVSKGVIVLTAVPLYALLIWEHWVLTRQDVKTLFRNRREASAPDQGDLDSL